MTLNEKIGIILKQHKEGEEFFNALDFMIKGDRSKPSTHEGGLCDNCYNVRHY